MGQNCQIIRGAIDLCNKFPIIIIVSFLVVLIAAGPADAEFIRGGATISPVSSVIKINKEGHNLDSLVESEFLFVFTETGEPVAQIVIKDVFSDAIYSEPLPGSIARSIRESNAILVFSNLREYGDFIKAYLEGTIDAFDMFIEKYPMSELREEAQRVIDGLKYHPFKMKGTSDAFNEFIMQYPENFYVGNATKRRDLLIFRQVETTGRISSYQKFINQYPSNMHVDTARDRIKALRKTFIEVKVGDLAGNPAKYNGKMVRFICILHSTLPVYVEGFSVGRKSSTFTSPRSSSQHLNLQVERGPIIMWRLFVERDKVDLISLVQNMDKGDLFKIYGEVFDIFGGAPWIEVHDIEKI